MDNREEKEIENALNEHIEDMQFEEIPETASSPINEPVKSGEVSAGTINLSLPQANQEDELDENETGNTPTSEEIHFEEIPEQASHDQVENEEPLDAPEQEVDLDEEELAKEVSKENGLHVPDTHAAIAANSLLGMANNALEIGGGFFVKIKKTKEILEFDEAIRIVEDQNSKNIQRIKLDKEDQALLRPILIQVLKNRAEELTPEQQLIAASISILLKKVQMMAEIRSENKMMVSKITEGIRATIREEIRSAKEAKEEEEIELVEVEDFDKKAA